MGKRQLTEEEIQKEIDKCKSLVEVLDFLRYMEQDGARYLGDGNGNIVCFEGRLGSGMTLSAVAITYQEYLRTKKPVYSNLKLNFPYKPLTKLNFNTVTNSILLIDDAFIEFDSRRSNSKKNLLWSYLFMQARRRGLQIFLDTPDISSLDPRIRRSIDIRGTCIHTGNDIFKVRTTDLRTAHRKILQIYGKKFYKLYDTKAMVSYSKKK